MSAATPQEDVYRSGNTSSGEGTPRTASARVDHRRNSPLNAATSGYRPATHSAATSRTSADTSPAPRAAQRTLNSLGCPPMQRRPAQLSIEHERLRVPGEDDGETDKDLLVVDFTHSKGVSVADTQASPKAPATAASSPSKARTSAKDEAARGPSFPSWRERHPSQARARAPSSASGRVSSVQSRGLTPTSQQRPSLVVDDERERDEQLRKFRIVRNLFASHEDGLRFCIVLDQLLAARAITSQEFEARLLLLPKHEAAKLKAAKDKEDARRRAREDRIWDVENVVRRAVPTEPPAMLAKLFNKGPSTTDASQGAKSRPTEDAAAAAEKRKALEKRDEMARKVAALEKALEDTKSDNAQLKIDLATALEKNRDADLVQSTCPTVDRRQGASLPEQSPVSVRGGSMNGGGGGDGDLWAAIEELRRAVAFLNQRVGTIEQREHMSMLEAIGQLRRDLQQLDQRAALMEGRQRAALGW